MKAKSLFKSVLVLSCGAMVMASCSKTDDFGAANLEQLQEDVYSSAFIKEFGKPAADHDWGFSDFSMVPVRIPEGSPRMVTNDASARRRAGGPKTHVPSVTAVQYSSGDNFLAQTTATAYFFLRIDNNIVLEELNGVQFNPSVEYYPVPEGELDNNVIDAQYNADNQGSINMTEFKKLNYIKDNNGVTIATDTDPIPESVFASAPTLADMAKHIPNARIADIERAFNKTFNSENFKIFWYVAKWQNSDKVVHVDGILVPKDQITINIPEYKKRIIVEDLKGDIKADKSVSGSDFDFNDVVFDAVTWNRGGQSYLRIILRAAGGTLPIYVNGVEVHDGVGYMFNTGTSRDYTFGKVIYEGKIEGNPKTFNFNSIPVEVEINGRKVTAESNIGEAPEKVAVDVDYQWVEEYTKITTVYSKFSDYVADKTVTNWWK